jgi:uncharacterized protein YjdB
MRRNPPLVEKRARACRGQDITCTSSTLVQGSNELILHDASRFMRSEKSDTIISPLTYHSLGIPRIVRVPRTPPIRTTHGPRLCALRLLGLVGLLAGATPMHAQSVAEVQVTPETMTLGVGQRQAIFAAAYDRQGNLIPSAKFQFWSSDTLIARVQKDGTVLGVSPGLAKIEARLQGRRASLAVLINGTGPGADSAGRQVPPTGTVLTLDPASVTLLPGESVRITPQALREDETPAPTGRVTWKSLRPEVARVDTSGLVFGVAPGRSIVQASTSTGLMTTARVDVEQADFSLPQPNLVLGPDESDTLQAVVPSQGNRILDSGIQWRSTDTTVVVVNPSGVVTGRSPGQAEIIAAGFSQERRATVVVHKLAQRLVVSPRPGNTVELPIRGTRRFTAMAEAADSSPVPEARIDWEVGDTALVSFNAADGTLTGKAAGTTTLAARMRGFEPVGWSIHVTPGLLALDRTRIGIGVGERATITGTLVDEQGKAIAPAPNLTWSSTLPQIATVTPAGVVDGLSPGHAIITASAPWAKSATADVFVVGDVLISSNRRGAFDIYQFRWATPDSLYPVIVDSATDIQAVLSPDRTRIAFSSSRSGSYDLYLTDADGRNLRRLTSDPGDEGEPAWAPDGSRIVYTLSPKGDKPAQIFSIRPDGTDQRALTSSSGGNTSPEVSSDGRSIVFVSRRDGNSEIYQMGIDGSDQLRLTKSSGRESSPHLLPNRDLLYVFEHSKGSTVMRQPAGGSEPLVVLQSGEPIASLDVSANGERIAYVVGKMADVRKGKARLRLLLQSLGSRSAAVQVALRPGEQVLSPSF